MLQKCASGSVGGARPCQGRGRGFESRLALFFISAEALIYQGFRIFCVFIFVDKYRHLSINFQDFWFFYHITAKTFLRSTDS